MLAAVGVSNTLLWTAACVLLAHAAIFALLWFTVWSERRDHGPVTGARRYLTQENYERP